MPNSSIFIISETPLPPKASSMVHEHWVDCVSPLWVDCVSPTLFESTACPLRSLGCLHAPTILRRLCRLPLLVLTPCQLPLLPLIAHQLHLEASSTSDVLSTVQPRTACLPSLFVLPTPPSTIGVSTIRSCQPPLLASTIS